MRDSLQDRLDEGIAGTAEERLALALQLAQILRAWHRMGKFHGSLTTDHVLVSGNGRVTLLEADSCAGPETEWEDVRAFGAVLEQLLVATESPLTEAQVPPTVEPIPLKVAALCEQTAGAQVTMKQVVDVLARQVRGGHFGQREVFKTPAGLFGLLSLATVGVWLAWLSFS